MKNYLDYMKMATRIVTAGYGSTSGTDDIAPEIKRIALELAELGEELEKIR